MLNDGLLKVGFSAGAVNMQCYLINMSPQTSVKRNVVEEIWKSNHIDLNYLNIFGCPTYMHITSEN